MIDVLRAGHATFTTPDLERQVDYYSDVLGLIVTERDKNRAFLATRTGLEAICLERGDKAELTRLSFQVAPDADLSAYARELSEHGIKSEPRNGISPGAARALMFTDLKGTVIELYSDYVFAKDDGKPAVVTPLKLGHVAHRVDDVQKTVKFYTDVLGFRVSDWHPRLRLHRLFRVPALRRRPPHRQFRVDPVAAAASHRLRGEGLAGDAPRLRLSRASTASSWSGGPAATSSATTSRPITATPTTCGSSFFARWTRCKDEPLGYFDPRPWHQDRPQVPKVWPKDTLRSYWGFGSFGTFPGYP